MNVSSLQELKQELQELPPKKLIELCLRLAKYKKDNKEFLSYLLFQSYDQRNFIIQVKVETDSLFEELLVQQNLYYIKKGLRRILRIVNKYCRYIDDKPSSAEVLIYFCLKIKESGIPIYESPRLVNLFHEQIKRAKSVVASLHEDFQGDYIRDLEEIEKALPSRKSKY